MFGVLDAILLANSVHADHFRLLPELAGLIHTDMVGNELAVILVGGHHIDFKTLNFSVLRHRADNIVSLVAIQRQDGDSETADNPLDVRDGGDDVIGCGLPIGLVVVEVGVPERGCAGVEGDGDVRGVLVPEQLVQHIRETESRRRVQPVRGEAGTFYHRIISPVYQGHSVKEKQFFHLGKFS